MGPGMLGGGCDSQVEKREGDSYMEVGALQRRLGVPIKWLCALEGRDLYEYFVWNVALALLCECCIVVGLGRTEGCVRQVRWG